MTHRRTPPRVLTGAAAFALLASAAAQSPAPTPHNVRFQPDGAGMYEAAWRPAAGEEASWTEYSLADGPWGQSVGTQECTAVRRTGCDPYRVKFAVSGHMSKTVSVRLRAVGPAPALDPGVPTRAWPVRNNARMDNRPPQIRAGAGWRDEGAQAWSFDVDPGAADRIALGGPFHARDPDSDTVRCELKNVTRNPAGQPAIETSGFEHVAGRQSCQLFLNYPLPAGGGPRDAEYVTGELHATDDIGSTWLHAVVVFDDPQ